MCWCYLAAVGFDVLVLNEWVLYDGMDEVMTCMRVDEEGRKEEMGCVRKRKGATIQSCVGWGEWKDAFVCLFVCLFVLMEWMVGWCERVRLLSVSESVLRECLSVF